MVRVGVIGVGMIGRDHIRRIRTVLAGGTVTAVSDVDPARAGEIGQAIGAACFATGEALIASAEVDAVLVASWGQTHEAYVLAALAAGKPVFCEKPLATTADACRRIVKAEVALGRRLIQVGFMRRYDPAYRALKDTLDAGVIGAPLLMHCIHRNASVPAHYTSDMTIVDTAVHEIDLARWLFAEEIVAARVLAPRRSSRSGAIRDPLLVLLELAGGALVDVEVSVNIAYGYDIRGEIVGETGTVALAESHPVVLKSAGSLQGTIPADWRERFLRAYDIEIQAWLDAVQAGTTTGPSAWDGLAATVTTDAALKSASSGERVAVTLPAKPALYG
jgi:myo-inositol 2-dehydrogenase/D-chiro-inositol 1-dehydrogenase